MNSKLWEKVKRLQARKEWRKFVADCKFLLFAAD
jgi:hypothetical protein